MGNYISCSLATPTLSKHGKPAATKVTIPSGEIKQFHVPIKAAELMLDTPNFFLVNTNSFRVGRRFSPLNADEDLDIGNVYVMFPMIRLNSTVITADMGPLFLMATAASSASKWASGRNVKVRPADDYHQPTKFADDGDEGKMIESWRENSEHEAAMPKLNLDDIDFSAPEFMHRLSMSRSKKPLLETSRRASSFCFFKVIIIHGMNSRVAKGRFVGKLGGESFLPSTQRDFFSVTVTRGGTPRVPI